MVKKRGRYHYLLHIVRLFSIFTDLQWGKNVQGLRPRTFLPNCKSVKLEKMPPYIYYILVQSNYYSFHGTPSTTILGQRSRALSCRGFMSHFCSFIPIILSMCEYKGRLSEHKYAVPGLSSTAGMNQFRPDDCLTQSVQTR